MTTREVTLTLPESLAEEADARGLLRPEVFERLVREELRRQRVEGLFSAADRLAEADIPPLTEEEVEAEIHAARTARRAGDAHRC